MILFVAISGTPIMVRDRLVYEYLHQTYRASSYCLATLLASLPDTCVSVASCTSCHTRTRRRQRMHRLQRLWNC